MKNKIFYLVSIILFLVMCFVVYYNDLFCPVLEIKSSDVIAVDFNHNQVVDKNEWVTLESAKVATDGTLSEKDLFILNQLAKKFAEDFFFNKKVRFVKNDLLVGGKSYSKEFNSKGFNVTTSPDEYKNLVDYIKGNVFYVYNLHNRRYHKYGCSHYLRSENYTVYEEKDLPLKAIPCSYCNKELRKKNKLNKQKEKNKNSIKLFLTDYTKQLIPQRTCSSNICKELLYQINSSKKSIDMAIYGYQSVPEIEAALVSAKKRGVKLRLVYDLNVKGETDYSDSKRLAELADVSANDYVTEAKSGQYSNTIMHNKFYIFDDKTVITGSANLSPNDMSGYSANSTLTVVSPEIAQIYKQEFEQMLGSKFHNLKTKNISKQNIRVGDNVVSVYFSPKDRITKNHIIPLIKKAEKTILMPAFLITDKMLAEELIIAHNRGVKVRVILDATSAGSSFSQIKNLRESGIPVKVENYAGKLHSKSIIIDSKISVIGSMNFSKSGQNFNDENVMIIENPHIANIYTQYFENLWLKIEERWLRAIPRVEGRESIGSCSDGVDNNYDGFIDKADANCQ